MMTRDDYELLREFQMERFREELAAVSGAYAALTLDYDVMIVSCQSDRDLEDLERSLDHFLASARIIMGSIEIRVFKECVRTATYVIGGDRVTEAILKANE